MAVASPRQQLEQLQSDRARSEVRLRRSWWEHVLAGTAAGVGVLASLATGSTGGVLAGSLLAFLIGAPDWWRETRTGMRRGTRFGGGWQVPALGGVAVVGAIVLGVAIIVRHGAHDPAVLVGLPLAAVLLGSACTWGHDRWSATRHVVRPDLAPAWQEGLEDPDRLRVALLLATADMRTDVLQELSGLDEVALAGHLAGLEAGRWVTSKRRRSVVVEDSTWYELTYVGRGGLARHLAEVDRLSRPTFHI